MKYRIIIFIAIALVCILSIGIGVYREETKTDKNSGLIPKITEQNDDKSGEELKKEFENILDNAIHEDSNSELNIKKINNNEKIVYNLKYAVTTENYEIDLNIPIININNNVANKFNSITQKIFADKANGIIKENSLNTIYTVSYTAYVYNNILSVIIKSNLKESTNAQRTIVQTYNYDLKNEKELTLKDVIEKEQISEKTVNNKIKTSIEEAIKQANKIQLAGYTVYERNIEDEMYKIENSNMFYINEQGKLYIIYAYGNNSFTSELDIIAIQ